MERSLAVVRLFYLVFCIVLLFAALKHLSTSSWKIVFFAAFPLPFHIIAGIGTLAFATWLVVILAEKEQQLHKKLYLSSITDSLTGLYNSAYLRERVKEEIRRYHREGHRFTLAFLDLDGFKKVNDRHGHLAGDGVLKQVAEALKNTRGQELLARYGGDEFVLLMPGASKEEGERTHTPSARASPGA